MPDGAVLTKMYGTGYAKLADGGSDYGIQDPKDPGFILTRLSERSPGVFLDYGCGSGSLLQKARALGWTAVGVEYDAKVVEHVAERTDCVVLPGLGAFRRSRFVPADVVYLGDVIEHLPNPLDVLREIVELLRPSGWLIAQGPLEAGPCLFSFAVQALGRLRRRGPVEMPPYHVLQATVTGQRILFERTGLQTLEYRVSEAAWPAASAVSAELLAHPKAVGLFVLRKLSQAVSAVSPSRWGNRYVYVGARESQQQRAACMQCGCPEGRRE